MSDRLERCVALLDTAPVTSEISKEITDVLRPQIQTLSASFINGSLRSLSILERWSWRCLAQKSSSCRSSELFTTLASFNSTLINQCDEVDIETKASLILPEQIDQTNAIFDRIDPCSDEDSWLILVNLWFENLSSFILECPQLDPTSLIHHINHQMAERFILTTYFQSRLKLLLSADSSKIHLKPKEFFHLKTCLHSVYSYTYSKPIDMLPLMKRILQQYGHDCVKIVCLQTLTIDQWTTDLLPCLSQCINGICACAFWEEENDELMKYIFPTETTLNEFAKALIRLLAYQPLYSEFALHRGNDTTMLFDVALFCLTNLIDRGNLRWFLRSIDELTNILLAIARSTKYPRFTFYAYGIFGELLSEEQLKELTFNDKMAIFYFDMLEQAWKQPSRIYKQISIRSLLRSHLSLSKNAFTIQTTADMKKIPLFIDLCNEYPIAYDLIWTLSFNTDVQQQLRAQTSFLDKLSQLAKHSTDASIRKVCSGILWNLQAHQDNPPAAESTKERIHFDIMISYCHKDKGLCRQLYDELVQRRFRVWIDFDQMHGNVMDAMAQAIEQSPMVIICMSEDYRRSNFCRAEAQYAFQRQRKLVPVLLQKHYKPEGWLLFLIGQLLYVDFTKHEFIKAMEMLLKQLGSTDKEEVALVVPKPSLVVKEKGERKSIKQWTKNEVQEWLGKNGLLQMSRLLIDLDGRSFFYFYRFMRNGEKREMVKLLAEDVKLRLKETLSLMELCRLLALIDQEYHPCNQPPSVDN